MSTKWLEVHKILEVFEESLKGTPIELYDFGDGVSQMPLADPVSGSYLTTSICLLVQRGKRITRAELPKKDLEIVSVPDGWKFMAIEIPYGIEGAEFAKKLELAKGKFLEEMAHV